MINNMDAKYKKSPIPDVYSRMKSKRGVFESKALALSAMTVPMLLSSYEKGSRKDTSPHHGWQGIAAQAVNHLANKLAITLFPAQHSFFTLDFNEVGERYLEEAGYEKSDLTRTLAGITRKALKVAERVGHRPALVQAMKHLIVTGNVCLYLKDGKDSQMQAIPLTHYGVKRDSSGNMLDFVLLQTKALNTFEPTLQALIMAARAPQKVKPEDEIDLYTRARRLPDGKYEVTQSADSIPVGEVSTVTAEKLPFLPITWSRNYGEDYGRGLVEEHEGDFFVIKFLSEAMARGMAIMADVRFLVKPGAYTDIRQLTKSKSGDFIFGQEGDVYILQLGKYADFTPIASALQEYRQRVGQVFMLESLIRRDAERVTAYEVRRDAIVADQGLNGVYSQFSVSIQRPLASWFLRRVSEKLTGRLEPDITTGLSALGNMEDLEKFEQLNSLMAAPASWDQEMRGQLDPQLYLKWCLSKLALDAPFFKDSQQLKADAYNQKQEAVSDVAAQSLAQASPEIISQLGGLNAGQ